MRPGVRSLKNLPCLRVHWGEVSAMPAKTRNRFDFLRFLEQLEAEIPAGQEVIAITDNLSTRTTHWLAAHPRWHFVFTPTQVGSTRSRSSSILTRRLLKHGAFASEEDLALQVFSFVENYKQTATAFQWTYTGKVLTA